ncbi:MAG: GIY-YIG nuclease family protein [Candidatus Portnoybacteria bacterium]|nr:GIY-YIG nuclease family protein [Candidatus Portnoybacteria bacterium]
MQKQYFVYIATNKWNTTLYTGITNNLYGRMYQHKNKLIEGFTKRYNINKPVYYELFSNIQEAILAEKRIKGWTRKKKVELIKSKNPEFRDLLEE